MYDIKDVISKSDKEFVEFIIEHDDFITNKEIFEKILNLNKIDFLNLISSLSEEILLTFINNKEFITIDDSLLSLFFLKNNDLIKNKIIENEEYLKRILKIKSNSLGRTPFDLSNEEIQLKILLQKSLIDEINEELYYNLLKKLDNKKFERIINQLNPDKFILGDENIKIYLKGKYNLLENDFLVDMIIEKFNNKKRSPYYLLKIDNIAELLIYEKFNMLIKVKMENDNIIFENNDKIPYKYIENINKKHVKSLIDKMKEENIEIDLNIILVAALKLYSIFGYDNSKKILENKFTYLTDSALNKIAEIEFISGRRKHRLKNQDRFYSHEMVNKFIEKAVEGDIEYFKYILGENYVYDIQKILQEIANLLKINDSKENIKEFIKQLINDREKKYKQTFIKEFKENLIINEKRSGITIKEIYTLFNEFNLSLANLDDKGKIIENKELTQFLLGNYKSDNNCLLRLVLNDKADGISDTLIDFINNFEIVKNIAEKSNEKLSLNSVLDLIEISKTFLYNMAPNEKDLHLESIAKILKSSKYCEKSAADIFIKARELHVLKKEKIFSSIPLEMSHTIDGLKCKIMDFDDESLITIGINTDSCLKIGSKGEDFLRYCLTNPNAIIISMKDEQNNLYICPFVRNGNGIYGNGIDPKPKDFKTNERIMNCLQEFTQKIIESSDKNEKIEFAVITDLHQNEYLKQSKYQEITINERVIIDDNCYSDFNKFVLKHEEPLKNYVISKISDDINIKNYLPKSKYYQKRIPNFICTHNEDKSIIEDMINSIYYNSINYKDITEKEKGSLKRNYKELKVEDFKHIVGNKDWFIAVDKNAGIISCLLPFDKRAKNEYKEALEKLRKDQNIFKEERSLWKMK